LIRTASIGHQSARREADTHPQIRWIAKTDGPSMHAGVILTEAVNPCIAKS
jgi:hypothetical protein